MLLVGLAATTIFISWVVMQVAFALHYAHQYYRPDHAVPGVNGLDFPKDAHPDYWDFFYFSTSIGAASQTSDVNINSKELRRLVTLHAIVAFFFNVAVVALMINLAASLVDPQGRVSGRSAGLEPPLGSAEGGTRNEASAIPSVKSDTLFLPCWDGVCDFASGLRRRQGIMSRKPPGFRWRSNNHFRIRSRRLWSRATLKIAET